MERSSAQSGKIELHNGEETPRLPEEIIKGEILPRLPVKSLLKFRCVAKSWCFLIGTKNFMKAHLKISIKSSTIAHNRMLFQNLGGFKECSLPSFDESFTDPITYNADVGTNLECRRDFLVGCCNGLVCIIRDGDRFILWNPATKKSKNLPVFDTKLEYQPILEYGFGFDELNDDYKVFGILNASLDTDVPFNSFGIVYSLRANSWEVIEVRNDLPFQGVGVYLRGKLHWYSTDVHKDDIVSFDLNGHVFGEVELPSYRKSKFYTILGVLGGRLSVNCILQNYDLDIWVMKEYGVKESWEKVAFVPYHKDLPCRIPRTLALGPDGEVLLIYGVTRFVIYNPKCGVYRHLQVNGQSRPLFYMCMYIESLASVASDVEQEGCAKD